jgi:hypothetical protein
MSWRCVYPFPPPAAGIALSTTLPFAVVSNDSWTPPLGSGLGHPQRRIKTSLLYPVQGHRSAAPHKAPDAFSASCKYRPRLAT